MENKKLFTLIAVSLLAFSTVIILSQVWGTPLKEVVAGIFLYILYGVLIISYVLRFALILIGVFALYRLLQEWYQKQIAV